MQTLELKIPPLALTLAVALAMGGASWVWPPLGVSLMVRVATGTALVTAGAVISLAGVISFRHAKTSVNPTRPHASSALVNSGIYGFSRNPMYLGFLLALIGWAAFLASPVGLMGPLAFVLYMNRFQITPEERALATLFGAEFAAYKTRVRRWL